MQFSTPCGVCQVQSFLSRGRISHGMTHCVTKMTTMTPKKKPLDQSCQRTLRKMDMASRKQSSENRPLALARSLVEVGIENADRKRDREQNAVRADQRHARSQTTNLAHSEDATLALLGARDQLVYNLQSLLLLLAHAHCDSFCRIGLAQPQQHKKLHVCQVCQSS